jgi:hypothetical protein
MTRGRNPQAERELEPAGRRRQHGHLAAREAVEHNDPRAGGADAHPELGDEDVAFVAGDPVDHGVTFGELGRLRPAAVSPCDLRRGQRQQRQRRHEKPHDAPM